MGGVIDWLETNRKYLFAFIRSLSAIALFIIRSIIALSDGGSIRGLPALESGWRGVEAAGPGYEVFHAARGQQRSIGL